METFLIVLVIISLIEVINGSKGSEIALIIFAVLLLIEKAISVYHSSHFIKEYIPKDKEVIPIDKPQKPGELADYAE